jgi:2Fe-2S ferredoxin
MNTVKTHKLTWVGPHYSGSVEIAEGQTVLEAAIENDIPLQHACGGFCACTTCHIHIKQGLELTSKIDEEELDRIEGKSGVTEASRLACQTKVFGDITIEIP